MRSIDIPKIIFLLTDGKQTVRLDSTPEAEARPMLEKKFQIFAVGVGSDINKGELQKIVGGDKEKIILGNSFHEILGKVNEIVQTTCTVAKEVKGE